jgi:hypothetical protein
MIFPLPGKARLSTFVRHTAATRHNASVSNHDLRISRRRERHTLFSLVWLASILFLSLFTHFQLAVPLLGLFCILRGIETRSSVLFIPGGLLAGAGLGLLLTAGPLHLASGDTASSIFLFVWALGLFSITFLSRKFTYHPQWWPLIPGGMMLLTSLALCI